MKKIIALVTAALCSAQLSLYAYAETTVTEAPTTSGTQAETTTETTKPEETSSEPTVNIKEEELPYWYVKENLNEGAELDADGNAMLVDKIDFDDGNKQLITIATRDGSVFYVIIDYTAPDGSNVYFLNKVDTADLMAIINSESNQATTNVNSSKPVETQKSGATTVIETDDNGSEIAATVNPNVSKSSSNTLLIVMVIAIVLIGVGYWFFKIRGGKGKHKGFDDTFEDNDNEDEEIQEDEEDDDI